MTYTFLQLKTAVEHALGGVPDARISSGLVVNRAIEYLSNYHTWSWRVAIVDLDVTAGQRNIDLPANFGELIQVSAKAGTYTYVKSVTAYELLELRRNGTADGTLLGFMVKGGPQGTATVAPVRQLAIAPVPAATVAAALTIVYRANVPTFAISGTADDAKVPAIPEGLHDTLYALCRAMAVSTEEAGGQTETAAWQQAMNHLERDVEADKLATAEHVGVLEGGTDGQYTFLQLKTEVEFAIGRDLADKVGAGRIVNRAIEYLTNYHSWRWRTVITTLGFTASQSHIDLPADFGEIEQLYGNVAKYSCVQPVSLADLLAMRVHGVSDSLYVGYALGISPQASPTARPRRRLEIAPTPGETLADALYLVYRKIIPAFVSSGSADDAKVPAIPLGVQHVLLQLVRAYACQVAAPEKAGDEWTLARQMLEEAKTSDGAASGPFVGCIRNTGVDNWYGDVLTFRPHTQIQTAYD